MKRQSVSYQHSLMVADWLMAISRVWNTGTSLSPAAYLILHAGIAGNVLYILLTLIFGIEGCGKGCSCSIRLGIWRSSVSFPSGDGVEYRPKTDLEPSDLAIWSLMPLVILKKRKTVVATQTLRTCNSRHLCFLMSAIYFIVNISKLHPRTFFGREIGLFFGGGWNSPKRCLKQTVHTGAYLVHGEIGVWVCDEGVRCDTGNWRRHVAQLPDTKTVEEARVGDHGTKVLLRSIAQRTQLVNTQNCPIKRPHRKFNADVVRHRR